jgi:DNA repair protein RecO (recombination protein O)
MPRGFLLHSRPFRESSRIATFLTDTDGRLDVIVRAARAGGKRRASVPLPFLPYELSWAGRAELKHLQYCEPAGELFHLVGQPLYCGFYLNELLWRLLPAHMPEPVLFDAYAGALRQLAAGDAMEPVLRRFELTLLAELGYGLALSCDSDGNALQADALYCFVSQQGLVPTAREMKGSSVCGSGTEFLAIAASDFASPAVCRLAKALLRTALAQYLGNKPLRSRELFAR